MNANENKQIVRDKFANFDNGDFEAFRKILADGFEATVKGGDAMIADVKCPQAPNAWFCARLSRQGFPAPRPRHKGLRRRRDFQLLLRDTG